MLVYRICSKDEVDYILNTGNFDLIGGLGKKYRCNNHKYGDNIYYVHFFLNKYNAIDHYFKKGKCICAYDIPLEILQKYVGLGRYKDVFCLEEYMIGIEEFAILREILKIDYLIKVEVLLCDFYRDSLTKILLCDWDGKKDSFSTIIYDTSKPMIRERKKGRISFLVIVVITAPAPAGTDNDYK